MRAVGASGTAQDKCTRLNPSQVVPERSGSNKRTVVTCFKVPVCDVDNDSLEQEASAEGPHQMASNSKSIKEELVKGKTVCYFNNPYYGEKSSVHSHYTTKTEKNYDKLVELDLLISDRVHFRVEYIADD